MQRTISGSFRLRLMALVMLGILPPLWGAIWYASYRATHIFRVEAQTSMAIRADVLGQQVDQWHEKNSLALDELRSEASFDTMERSQQLPNMLSTLKSNQTEVESVVTLDLNGEVVADAGLVPIERDNYRHQSWFQSAAAGAENSRVMRSPSKSDPTVIFSKPILAQPKLAVGDRNPKVAQLQRRLKDLNYYSGPIDGIYAGETVEAITQFKQAYHQEDASGDRVDPITWQSIDVAGGAANPSKLDPVELESVELDSAELDPAELDPARQKSNQTIAHSQKIHPSAEVEGVVMIEAQLSDIKQAIDNVQSDDEGYAFLLDEKGRVLVQSEQAERPQNKLEDNSLKNSKLKVETAKLASPESVHRAFLQAQARENTAQSGLPTKEHPLKEQLTQEQPQKEQLTQEQPNPERVATTAKSNAAVLPSLRPFASGRLPDVLGASSLDSQAVLGFWDHQGDRWIAHSEVLANGWRVVLAQPNESFSREASLFRHLSIVTGAIALLVTAIALSILSARLTQPILKLSHAANAISLGHLDQKVTVKSHDEIGTLANAFNSVAEQLQQSFAQLADQNEALKKSDKLKDQFLANTSHELKTPLNGMIGIAESLLEGAAGPLNDAQRHNISMIASSSHRLTRLVNDILDFSKLQHQQLSLHPKPIGIFASVNVVLALSQTLVGTKSLTLENNISVDCPLVWADENRVQQILLNLVSNAIKFTHSGSVSFSAELVEQGRAVAISVRDTGIGIADECFTHIFQPFQQVEQAAKSYGGTGLGLSIVQHLVSLHGGKLWVSSALDEGSTFTFTLPVAETAQGNAAAVPLLPSSVQPEQPTKSSVELSQLRSLRRRKKLATTITNFLALKKTDSASKESSSDAFSLPDVTSPDLSLRDLSSRDLSSPNLSPRQFNILVVDDEPINVQVLRNHLSLGDYTVTHAFNGAEALALLNRQRKNAQCFDLVVLDVMMPRMSGYEVCQKLREIYPAHELPVVMLTAKNQVSDLITGFHFGANDYMTKPFSKDELLTRIKSHLRLSKTNHSYGRFVPSEYLRFLKKESIVDVRLGDHVSKEMAVMFSDIRSFTRLSESMTPQENFDFVNAYLRQVSPVIRDHQGFIVKYLGDGMMAVFPDGVDDAIAAAIAKQNSVAGYNQRRASKGFQPIHVGIGIHFGHMMVGMVGESARMQGDAFSDNVNLTARLEGLTKHYGVSIILSGQALALLSQPDRYRTRFLDRVIVKGRSEAIEIYQIIEGEPAAVISQIEQTKTAFEQGLLHYQSGDFLKAKSCFDEILHQFPADKTARIYCDRLETLLHSPPEYWDGVWTLTEK